MGVNIDGFGNEIDPDAPKKDSKNNNEPEDPNDLMFMHNKHFNSNNKLSVEAKGGGKDYTPINTYKPSGNLIYNEVLLKNKDLFKKITNILSFLFFIIFRS